MNSSDSKDTETNNRPIKVTPKAFAVDEKLFQSIVVFESAKLKTSFSVVLGAPEEISGLVKGSSHSQKSPYNLCCKIMEQNQLKPKKAVIKNEHDVDLCLKKEELKGFQKVNVSIPEMLGLWNVSDFPIYAMPDYIESVRSVDLVVEGESSTPKSELYKIYGQKYLM